MGGRNDFSGDRSAAVRREAPAVTKLKDILLFDKLHGGVQATAKIFFFTPFLRFLAPFLPHQPILRPLHPGKKRDVRHCQDEPPAKKQLKASPCEGLAAAPAVQQTLWLGGREEGGGGDRKASISCLITAVCCCQFTQNSGCVPVPELAVAFLEIKIQKLESICQSPNMRDSFFFSK